MKATALKRKPVDITSELLRIQDKQGILTAEGVLKEAKKKRHPLNSYFDWNDTTAGKRWRVHQANMMIAQAKVTIVDHEETRVHAFVSVKTEEGRQFVYTADAIGDNRLLLQIFDQLNTRIENIQEQLNSMNLLKGTVKKALEVAKKPISKPRAKLKKVTKLKKPKK